MLFIEFGTIHPELRWFHVGFNMIYSGFHWFPAIFPLNQLVVAAAPPSRCPRPQELSFARAVGGEGNQEAMSLNAAALFAYQNEQARH